MARPHMIEAQALTKKYGSHLAVSELTFSVGRGEVVGFLGPNGAGKTTTLRMLAGFLGATSGRVVVGGYDVAADPIAARRQLGYMPESCPLYTEMRVSEYLAFRAELKQVPRPRRKAAIARALTLSQLGEREHSLIGHLSKGYRQRLGLADALVADPPLLILDEPTSGLDPNQIRDVRRVIAELSEQHTILLSTHILAEVEVTCGRALVIHRGKLVAAGTLAELQARGTATTGSLVLRVPEQAPALPNELVAQRSSVQTLTDGYELWEVQLQAGRAGMQHWVQSLAALGYGIAEARLGSASLEQVFAQLTQESAN